jgi:hypothetical protein
MSGNRREFLKGVAALPVVAVRQHPRRQLMLRLDYKESPVLRRDRLIISFDLWRCCVQGLGGEAALGLTGNLLPADTAVRISEWFVNQDTIGRLDINPLLWFHDCGIPISFTDIVEFFARGECEIVPFAGDDHER